MSDNRFNISSDALQSEFSVPQDYFSNQKKRIQISIDRDDLIPSQSALNVITAASATDEFAVPEGYFLLAEKEMHKFTNKKISPLLVLTITTAIAASWLIGILIWNGTKNESTSFEDLLAESVIEPQDLLLHSSEEEIYWAYAHLCDTLISDSTSMHSAPERLDPKTGLPASKARQLEHINWDDISPEDALEYLKETNADEDNYN